MSDEKNMNEEEESSVIIFTDENGEEIELELLDIIQYEGKSYVALVEPEGEEVMFYEAAPVADDADDENYLEVSDETLSDILFDIFKKTNEDAFDFED